MDLEKAYNRTIREALWQVLRKYDVVGKLLNGIKSVYINSPSYIRLKGVKRVCFRIEIGVRKGCIMSPCLFNLYIDAVMREVKMGMGVRFLEEGENGDSLVSCMQMTCFV